MKKFFSLFMYHRKWKKAGIFFIGVRKVFWQLLCKLENHCLKTQEIGRKTFQKTSSFLWKKRSCPNFPRKRNKADPKEKTVMVHKHFEQLLCLL